MEMPHNWHKEHKRNLSFGDRAADRMRNSMGSWRFVILFIAFMVGWVIINTYNSWWRWDHYPFVLLNLFLSMLAALQGAILLIAARRADAISAAMAESDYHNNKEVRKEVEKLIMINDRQMEIIESLERRLAQK